MTIRGDSKAMPLNLVSQVELVKTRQCPHPFCGEFVTGLKADLRKHYEETHRCGRCNHEKHHKCKKDLCSCSCRWRSATDVGTKRAKVLDSLMHMAASRMRGPTLVRKPQGK